jgi:hypothetical protein
MPMTRFLASAAMTLMRGFFWVMLSRYFAESCALTMQAPKKPSLRGAKRRGNPEMPDISRCWIAALRSQ